MTTMPTTATKPTSGIAKGAWVALVLLTGMNFVNYLDRYILPAVQEQVKGEFHLSDGQIGVADVLFFCGVCVRLADNGLAWRSIPAQADDCRVCADHSRDELFDGACYWLLGAERAAHGARRRRSELRDLCASAHRRLLCGRQAQ